MPFSLSGFVLETPRVGQSNSTFSQTPNNVIADSGAFNTAYPSNESVPRTDYCVIVIGDGKLADVTFGWTKNEGAVARGAAVQRFGYHPRRQTFLPLPGSSPTVLGLMTADANTTRFKVPVPVGVMASAPFRVAVGPNGSGNTFATSLVLSFGTPSVGTVEILSFGPNAGQLNWNPADLVTWDNQVVRFQQQSFFTVEESNGFVGPLANNTLVLNPLPGPGQYPLIRIGYGLWLTTVERANEASFSGNPTSGTVEWSRNTGLLKFNTTDLTTFAGKGVYYDGSLFGKDLTFPTYSFGTVNAAGTQGTNISPMPSAGGDIIFRVPGVVQFSNSVLVTSFDTVGKRDQVEYNAAGQVRLSLIDRTSYGGQPLEAIICDLPIERGIETRWFRTPVDLSASDASLKDLTSIYPVTGAIWADPMIASPKIYMPSKPIESASYPITVTISQGTGSYTGPLPNHDVPNPSAGLGFVINYDEGILQYTRRNTASLLTLREPNSVSTLEPLILGPCVLELETGLGSGSYTTLTENVDYLLNRTTGQVGYTSTFGVTRTIGLLGEMSGSTLTDIYAAFVTDGVAVGDLLVIKKGAAKGVYTVLARSETTLTLDVPGNTATAIHYEIHAANKEIMADRFFQPVEVIDPKVKLEKIRVLGTVSNSPRLTSNLNFVTRFRFGLDRYSTSVTTVSNDGAFANPNSLGTGVVQISQSTGNLNFSSADVTTGGSVYAVTTLVPNKDYRLNPISGFIDFTERMLTGDEGLFTYSTADAPSVVLTEPITFQIRKETTPTRSNPASVVTFNPNNYRVATTPAPKVFRGGRPQSSTQVIVDTTTSTITFLPDEQLTDALPHGDTIAPNERVVIDYYIHDAVGGEKATNTLFYPLSITIVSIQEGTNSFILPGDHTGQFQTNRVLRVGASAYYMIGSATYSNNTTTVTLAGTQVFADSATNPKLYVGTGITSLTANGLTPAYFNTELSNYDPIPRGMNTFRLVGNRESAYKTNTIVVFTNGVYTDVYSVNGAKFDADTNRTEISLSSNTLRQYVGTTLKHSVRPIYDSAPNQASTLLNPVLTFPTDPDTLQYLVYRRIPGQVGVPLENPEDYKIDDAGVALFEEPLQPYEEFCIFYTGRKIVPAGYRLRSSYTCITAPTPENGLLNQVMKVDYSIFSPDSAYFRVETITNYRSEMADKIDKEVKQAAPSGGPQATNSSSPKLPEQGRESIFFKEGQYFNEDMIARTILKYYNDAINYLEDALQAADGRVVGDRDGRFRFDGLLNTSVRTVYSDVTNDIDDLFLVAPVPVPSGTIMPLYQPNPFSRLFPTRRNLVVGPTVAGEKDHDPIGKFPFEGLSSVIEYVRRRIPRARVLGQSSGVLSCTFTVDTTGTTSQRPSGFAVGQRVVIQDSAGVFYLEDIWNGTVGLVTGVTPTTITVNDLDPAEIPSVPAGATIYLAPSDADEVLSDGDQDGFQMEWVKGKDWNVSLESGTLTFIKRKPPYDATFPLDFVPKILWINEIPANTALQFNNTGIFNKDVLPDKIPALFGDILDDDRDETIPLVGPVLAQEYTSTVNLTPEIAIIAPSTGTIRSAVTPSFVGTGSLDATKLIITNSVNFPAPVPKVHDLVRILTGLNSATSYRRIVAVTANTVTVDSDFSLQDSGFSYTISVSSLTVTGTGTFSGTNLTDGSATFTTSAKVGQTVVITNGTDTALRRQIAAIGSNTSITLNAAFPTATTNTYRIDNPLATFGGTGSILASLSTILATELAAIPSGPNTINNSLLAFFDTVFTDVVTSVVGVTSGTTLTDATGVYVTQGVSASHFVFITTGANVGLYRIATVDSHTQLTMMDAFPFSNAGQSYKIVSVFGISYLGLSALFGLIRQNVRFFDSISYFKGLVDTPVTVLKAGATDTGAFARALLTSDVDYRATLVQDRIDSINTPSTGLIGTVENTLKGTERLYDKRYTWIDARTNIEKGLLYKKSRSIEDRQKVQAEILKALVKLLTVRT